MAITRWEPFRRIERWEPLREMETLRREMDRLFDRMIPFGDGEEGLLAFTPSVEMEETDEAINLRLEIPGMDPKDLDIQVSEESVSIRGERKSESRTEEQGTIRSEFRYGKFQRIIPLPAHIQTDQVKAENRQGVLHLILPKAEEERRKVVKVQID
uniref:Heat shock protein Hsp20 n=1 Tax=Cyanothece sp. (strain PCC 7425 / ATCC 29141) TaxID=395961 RepID=B8HJQ7_CYAP4